MIMVRDAVRVATSSSRMNRAHFNCAFTATIGLRGKEPNGPEEQAEQRQFDSAEKGYRSALLSSLKRTRELLNEGRL